MDQYYFKQQIINNNVDRAYSEIPESLIPIKSMMHLNVKINNKPFKFLVDTGASTTMMSLQMAKDLDIENLIDYYPRGKAIGVNSSVDVEGRIHCLDIQLDNGKSIAWGVTILKDTEMALLGLDIMKAYRSNIDLKNNTVSFGDYKVSVDIKY